MRPLLAPLLFLAPLLLPLAASAYDKIVVVTAGITTYDHGDPRPACEKKRTLCHLPNAGRDADDFADLMAAGPWLGAVEVRRLPETEATKAGILRALRAAGRSAGSGKTLVVFYFTGHGLTYGDVGFIVPRDGRQDDPDSWISVTTLRDLLRQPELGEVRHVLFILASCFSGTLLKGDVIPADAELQVATPADQRYIERELGRRARVGITAGLDGERIPDGKRGEGSDFGRALVQALTPAHGLPSMPADQNGDGCVTHLELASYVHNKGRSDHNTPALGTLDRDDQGTVLLCRVKRSAEPVAPARPIERPKGSPAPPTAPTPGQVMAEATSLRPALRFVPPGTFTMGSPASEAGRSGDEVQHLVTLTQALWVMETEVTQGQWMAVMGGDNPAYFAACGPSCPVEQVSWVEAVHYANALSMKDKLSVCYRVRGEDADVIPGCAGYRLPTEAEWEYAARAGSGGARYGAAADVAWFEENSGGTTNPVAQKRPNAWGLYDMLGNVLEWTGNWYAGYDAKPGSDPSSPPSGRHRVLRGGSWYSFVRWVRAAYRFGREPGYRDRVLGFRLVRRP